MSSRSSTLLAACALALASSAVLNANAGEPANQLAEPTIGVNAKFKPLFNGRNLDGWKHVGPGEFVVENGVLKTVGGMGLLWYTGEKFRNAVIRVVYKAPDD